MNEGMKILLLIYVTLFSSSLLAQGTSIAQGASNWKIQNNSLLLSFYSPSKYVTIAVAYEKTFFRCKPSVAMIIATDRTLGVFRDQKELGSRKNKLNITVSGQRYEANGDTVLNKYANGMEVVAFFDEDLVNALKTPSSISVSFGSSSPVFTGSAGNSINLGLDQIKGSCEN